MVKMLRYVQHDSPNCHLRVAGSNEELLSVILREYVTEESYIKRSFTAFKMTYGEDPSLCSA